MISLYKKLSVSSGGRIQIENMKSVPHPHTFPVLNSTLGGLGTKFKLKGSEYTAQESDLVFMPPGIWHESTDLANEERLTIAVFDPRWV